MLSRKAFLEWCLKQHRDKDYKSDAEKRFFEQLQNPPEPTEKLKELVREYGHVSR